MRIWFRSCGTTILSKNHIVETCKRIRADEDVFVEEARKLDKCDIEEFGRLFVQRIEKMISILSDKMWPQTENLQGDRISKQCLRTICK